MFPISPLALVMMILCCAANMDTATPAGCPPCDVSWHGHHSRWSAASRVTEDTASSCSGLGVGWSADHLTGEAAAAEAVQIIPASTNSAWNLAAEIITDKEANSAETSGSLHSAASRNETWHRGHCHCRSSPELVGGSLRILMARGVLFGIFSEWIWLT